MIAVVRLRDGTETPAPLVTTTMLALHRLLNDDPIGLYELAMRSRDRDHQLWGDYEQRLESAALLHPAVLEIVRNAIEGDGMDMRLRSPLDLERQP
jgi:hypothetical protein